MKNGGMTSGTRERARVGASDLQASPLAEGDRRLWPSISDGTRRCKARGLAVEEWCGWADVGRGTGRMATEYGSSGKHVRSSRRKRSTGYLEESGIRNVELTGHEPPAPTTLSAIGPPAPAARAFPTLALGAELN